MSLIIAIAFNGGPARTTIPGGLDVPWLDATLTNALGDAAICAVTNPGANADVVDDPICNPKGNAVCAARPVWTKGDAIGSALDADPGPNGDGIVFACTPNDGDGDVEDGGVALKGRGTVLAPTVIACCCNRLVIRETLLVADCAVWAADTVVGNAVANEEEEDDDASFLCTFVAPPASPATAAADDAVSTASCFLFFPRVLLLMLLQSIAFV